MLCLISSFANSHTGAASCQISADGKNVACGGMSTSCQISADGKNVACGGMSTSCQISADGKNVACGGGKITK